MTEQWQTLSLADIPSEELYKALRLRQEVFAVEQNCVYLDLDGLDLESMHMLYYQQDKIVAYQRCLPPGLAYEESSLGRIVVNPIARGQQLGRELVQRGIDFNVAQWPGSNICISAQAHLQDFYASLGFVGEGENYQEDGIPHRKMRYTSGAAEN